MKLLKNVYYELEKAKIVGTFEEFSTEFLKKDRSTMSFLLNRKREMSLYAQINCLKEIHKHIEYLKDNEKLRHLNIAKDMIRESISNKYKFQISI
jgi:hypothetical protein|tara:strand:+ start:288 stop:572 length:285 start_codon:yes stop_codon:yes gene_type:complete